MAHRRLQQGRGEPVHGPGQRRSPDADPPAAQHPEHDRRRSRETGRGQDGQADLRAEQAGHRREQSGRQQQRGVPHQVDAPRCIHPGRDQGGQPTVPHSHRRVPHEPGVQVGVMRIPRHHPRRGICPQPPRHHHARKQVTAPDRDTRPANRQCAPAPHLPHYRPHACERHRPGQSRTQAGRPPGGTTLIAVLADRPPPSLRLTANGSPGCPRDGPQQLPPGSHRRPGTRRLARRPECPTSSRAYRCPARPEGTERSFRRTCGAPQQY